MLFPVPERYVSQTWAYLIPSLLPGPSQVSFYLQWHHIYHLEDDRFSLVFISCFLAECVIMGRMCVLLWCQMANVMIICWAHEWTSETSGGRQVCPRYRDAPRTQGHFGSQGQRLKELSIEQSPTGLFWGEKNTYPSPLLQPSSVAGHLCCPFHQSGTFPAPRVLRVCRTPLCWTIPRARAPALKRNDHRVVAFRKETYKPLTSLLGMLLGGNDLKYQTWFKFPFSFFHSCSLYVCVPGHLLLMVQMSKQESAGPTGAGW